MANPNWLDSLSEEWVSQPRGPESSPPMSSSSEGNSVQKSMIESSPLRPNGNWEEEEQNNHKQPASTMKVEKQKVASTPDWKRMIIEDMAGPTGAGKDLFSPMGLENIFRPPPTSPSKLSMSIGPPSPTTNSPKPKHQFGGATGSLLPLPKSLLKTTTSAEQASEKKNPPLPALNEEIEAASEPPTPAAPRPLPTSPIDDDSVAQGSSGFKPIATSTLRNPALPKPPLPPQFLRPDLPQTKQGGKRKADRSTDVEGDTGSQVLFDPDLTKKENLKPGTVQSQVTLDSTNNSVQVEQDEGISEIALERNQTIGGRVNYTPILKGTKKFAPKVPEFSSSVYPSSPPWLPGPKKAEHTALFQSEPVLGSPFEDSRYMPLSQISTQQHDHLQNSTPQLPPPLPPKRAKGTVVSSPLEDPFGRTKALKQRAQHPRTPSPKKTDVQIEPSSRSPLKLFAGTYDTFTKERLVRRISQLEETSPLAPENNVNSGDEEGESVSSDLSRSNNKLDKTLTSPPMTPERESHFQSTDGPQSVSLRRPRYEGSTSSSSLPNDGINGPKSPLKERTPKRIRRTLSGGHLPLEQTPSEKIVKAHARSASSSPTRQGRFQRSPTPSTNTPARESSYQDFTSPQAPSPPPTSPPGIPQTAPLQNGESSTQSDKLIFGSSGTLIAKHFAVLGVGKNMENDDRKGSVTTQDFLAQAEEVMLRIRAMKSGKGGTESLNQSQMSDGTLALESFYTGGDGDKSLTLSAYDITKESSRFPSSPGSSSQASKEQLSKSTLVGEEILAPNKLGTVHFRVQEDNSCSTHELDDKSEDDRDSVGSQGFDQDDYHPGWTKDTSVASGQPGKDKQAHISNSTNGDRDDTAKVSGDLRPSPRGSRRSSKSETVRVIHPDEVEHLIPQNFGAMVFDPGQKAWVKKKEQSNGRSAGLGNGRRESAGRSAADETEEDPFHGISDLSVDEEMEARALTEVSMKEMISELEEYIIEDSDHEDMRRHHSKSEVSPPPHRKDEQNSDDRGKSTLEPYLGSKDSVDPSWLHQPSSDGAESARRPVSSSGRSFSAGSAFTEVRIETRSTSWGESYKDSKEAQRSRQPEVGQLSIVQSSESDDEDDEGYLPRQRSAGDQSVEYSSPSVSNRSSRTARSTPEQWRNEDELDGDTGDSAQANQRQAGKVPKTVRNYTPGSGGYRRRLSSGGKNFVGRPVSRINEEDEDGNVENRANFERDFGKLSLSSALTPLPSRSVAAAAAPPPATIRRTNVSFHLSSPLPELSYRFETTEALLNLELTYVAGRHHGGRKQLNPQAIECSFSMAQDDLVRHLNDVEPYEPYWDYMKYLKLSGRKILTLHGLHEWCPRLEELDVSKNDIGQLSGVPSTVRHLKVMDNNLSSLTAWNHLVNLQYVDVSRNDLDSLAGFQHLIHLRELKADDNRIEGLEEIMGLDGLLVISARRNRIKVLDFDKALLTRLSELDIKGNMIERISNLENLPSLASLCLDGNRLEDLGISSGTKMESVRTVKLTANRFSHFDVTPFTNLRTLFIDDNLLENIHGLRKAKHLDSLSMREQYKNGDRDRPNVVPVGEMFEIRKIYASGNAIRSLDMKLDFLNLQYLELASVQLTSLPENFGHLMSNIRVLNMNYNAISDIRPVFGIVRLKKLLMVGNRLRSMRKIASVLGYFPSLSFLDLRMNPLTLGFYPPATARTAAIVDDTELYPGEPFTLAPGDEALDRTFQTRLDLETAMFRRRYEIVISEKSPRMKYLDGLRFQKSETLRRDPVWEELKKVGLIKSDVGQVEGKKEEQKVVLETNGDVETEDGAESTSVGDSGEYDER